MKCKRCISLVSTFVVGVLMAMALVVPCAFAATDSDVSGNSAADSSKSAASANTLSAAVGQPCDVPALAADVKSQGDSPQTGEPLPAGGMPSVGEGSSNDKPTGDSGQGGGAPSGGDATGGDGDGGDPAPVEPIEPVEPTEPTEPTDPIDPTNPTEPAEKVRTSIAKADISFSDNQVYTGKQIKPKVTVTLDGTKLVARKDYRVTFKDNVGPGTATLRVKGIGDYKGSVYDTFFIAATGGLAADHAHTFTVSKSGKVLAVANGSSAGGAKVVQYAESHAASQQWILSVNTNGTVSLVSVKSGKALSVCKGRAKKGAYLAQYKPTGARAQQWIIVKSNGAYLMSPSLNRNLVIDIKRGSKAAGARAVLASRSKASSQRMKAFDVTAMRARIDKRARRNAGIVETGMYRLDAKVKGSYSLGMRNGSAKDGATAVADRRVDDLGQIWDISYDSAGFAHIKNVGTGKMLQVAGSSSMPGSKLEQRVKNDSVNQKWILVQTQPGAFVLCSALWENLVVEPGKSLKSGALQLCTARYTGNRKQLWAQSETTLTRAQAMSAQKFVDIALGEWECGEADGTQNKGGQKYWSQWYEKRVAWCSEFVGWCAQQAGLVCGLTLPERPVDSWAYVQFFLEHPEFGTVHEANRYYTPRPGDIVVHAKGDETTVHTELVESCDGAYFYAVSGNIKNKTAYVLRATASKKVYYFITVNWVRALEVAAEHAANQPVVDGGQEPLPADGEEGANVE